MAAGLLLAHAGLSGGAWGAWVVAVLAGLVPGALYLIGVHRLRHRWGRPWSPWRTASFAVGCVLLSVALSPVIEQTAVEDARGHMVQHLILGMYAPLGLVLGAPLTLLLGASPVDARRTMRRMLGRRWLRLPANLVVATSLNVGGLYLLYLTPLYALSTRSDIVHHLTHVHFLVAGSLFAWAITGPDPSPARAPMAWRVVALIAAAGAHNVLAKLLYARAPDLPPGAALHPAEVEAAAQWMYWGGHLAEALLLVALFGAWYRKAPRVRPRAPARPRALASLP
jgi:putative membrane protein